METNGTTAGTAATKPPRALTLEEKWQQATLADNFIFYKIMTENPDVCKELLEILLGIEIDRLERPLAEKNVKVDYDAKGIRFDVYARDGGRCFDIEMQTTTRRNLAKRARYYQGLIDVDTLKAGETYNMLKDSYVIFLCLGDVIGRGLPVYTFENRCHEDRDIALGDRAYKVFFNAEKYDTMASAGQRSFFKFLCGGGSESAFTDKLGGMIERAKHNAQWRQQFMTWEMALKEEGEEKWLEGAQHKAIETARNFLSLRIAPEIVAQGTGLSLEQVEQLQRELSAVNA